MLWSHKQKRSSHTRVVSPSQFLSPAYQLIKFPVFCNSNNTAYSVAIRLNRENSRVSGQIFHTKNTNPVKKYTSRILLNIYTIFSILKVFLCTIFFQVSTDPSVRKPSVQVQAHVLLLTSVRLLVHTVSSTSFGETGAAE